MEKSLTEQVYQKLHQEYLSYLSNIKTLSEQEIESKIYELLFKQEIVDMFKDRERYNDLELTALSSIDNCLNYLYENINGINYSIEEHVEVEIEKKVEIAMLDLATDYFNKQKQEIINSKDGELILMISSTLNDIDNYDYCRHIKSKYEIEDFNVVEVNKILNTKGGSEYLYHYFAQLVDNEHLQYLNEISLVDSENFNNIEEKILPKLKEIMQKEKVKQNKERDDR